MISEEKISFFANLLNGIPLEDVAELFEKAVAIKLPAGNIYINRNDKTKKLAYIERGIIRTYAIKENGDEATLLLRWEDQFIASHDSIILNQPSRFIYQAIEDTSILEIDYTIIEDIMDKNPEYEPLRNFVLMSMLSGTLEMIEDFVLFNPEERYIKLISEKFDIVNRVPDKYIASMLGITPVSLSRIRKRIASRKK